MSKTVWVAGFAHNRAATRIHDDLKAVATVIDDGEHRVGIVALDAIGFFHDEVLAVRRSLPSSARLDYVVVASTHNHSAPDLMGIWGPSDFDRHRPGLPARGRGGSGRRAAGRGGALAPAAVAFVEVPLEPRGLVADSRDPQVFDSTLRVMHFTAPDGKTIGSIVNWANHPETPWAENTELTADFPGYARDAVEQGITVDGKQVAPGLGGIHVYVNGAIGGLMTTNPRRRSPIRTPAGRTRRRRTTRPAPSAAGWRRRCSPRLPGGAAPQPHATVAAAGRRGAHDGAAHRQPAVPACRCARPLRPRTAALELHPHRGGGAHIRGRQHRLRAGRALSRDRQRRHRAPSGADFDIEPVEVPALRALMPGGMKFLIGLANDEVGYIIPKSEWDNEAPWLYGSAERHYGEINSLGPETGPILHAALRELMASLRGPGPAARR